MASSPKTQPPVWLVTGCVIATAGVFVIALGLTYPLLAFIMKSQGVSATLIGANSAMSPLGIIVIAPLLPRLAIRVGAARLAALCAALSAFTLLLIAAFQDVWFWFPARFALGMAANGCYVISETWVNQLAESRNRGRIMGFYTTVLSAGFGLGPFILALTGTESLLPFVIVVAIMALTAVILFSLRAYLPRFQEGEKGSLRAFLPLAPVLLTVIMIIAFFDQAAISLLPVYGLLNGQTAQTAALAVGILVTGSTFLQFPIGALADRLDRWQVMTGCSLISLVCCLALPWVMGSAFLLWPLLFVWGGSGFGGYTIALADLGDRFSGSMLLAGNAAFAMAWGLGGILGPPLAGGAMDLFGPHGLPACLGLSFVALTIMSFIGRRSAPGS